MKKTKTETKNSSSKTKNCGGKCTRTKNCN